MLARPLARAMLASWFVSRGIDAVRHPADHVAEALPVLQQLVERASGPTQQRTVPLRAARAVIPARVREASAQGGAGLARVAGGFLDEKSLRRAVQVHGAVTALTGLSLVLGKAPRTAALALAALSVPILVGNLPLRVDGESREQRRERRERLVQALTATGGAILAGVDMEGRPGVAWRVGHARELRAHARTAAAGG